MYYKYVIKTIDDILRKYRIKNINNNLLEDKLYESYLNLEKMLDEENS